MIPPTHKTCTKCGLLKPFSEFFKDSSKRGGLQSFCKACSKIASLRWIAENPERRRSLAVRGRRRRKLLNPDKYRKVERNYALKSRYGITDTELEQIAEAQGGACKLCKRCFLSAGTRFVDHDHDSGAVRGLLCARCNTLIGYLEKNSELIPQAMAYISEHSQQIVGGAS